MFLTNVCLLVTENGHVLVSTWTGGSNYDKDQPSLKTVDESNSNYGGLYGILCEEGKFQS